MPHPIPARHRTAVRHRTTARRRIALTASALAVGLVLAGCGGDDRATSSDSTGSGFPRTVSNCGHDVQIPREPERVVALGPSEVTTIVSAGGAAKLVARDDAGERSDPYPRALRDTVRDVPQLGNGGEVTRENLIALEPDLVVGSVSESITPDSLASVGIPMISLRGNCGSKHAPGAGDGTADFADVNSDVRSLGALLGTSSQASDAIKTMDRQVDAATKTTTGGGRTAAAVIVVDGVLEAYGRPSMAHTQLKTLGLDNVFGDASSRVFEANIEEMVARDPDVVVILSYGESDAQAKTGFLQIPGARELTAVRDDAVLVQPYEYSSQGTLSVLGLTNMSRTLDQAR